MDYKLFSVLFFSLVFGGNCKNLDVIDVENTTATAVNLTEGSLRQGRSQSNLVYVSLISCAMSYDTACLMDSAGKLLEIKKNELLAQADLDAFRGTGRADPEHTPSQLAKTIEQLISELSGAFKDGLFNFFSSKEGDDEDVVEADEKDDASGREVNGEVRENKKKKKKPLKSLIQVIKIAILGGIVFAKINLLLRAIETAIKFKFLLVAVGGLLIHGIKLWIDLKASKKNNHEENIVFRNPYEHGGDWGSGGQGEYHARSYEDRKEFAQNLAYSKFKRS